MGRIVRVNGPLVEADQLAGVAMADLVEIGRQRAPAEVVSMVGDRVTLQAYEYTGGLAPGDPVYPLGRPLAARLGPGLLGGVFDGLLRPLNAAGTWLAPGSARHGDGGRSWAFTPTAEVGCTCRAGDVIGLVDAGPVPHRVLVPPGVSGRLDRLAQPGLYGTGDPIATIGGVGVTLASWWPVRHPRPCRERRRGTAPLLTGQRVLDAVFPIVKGGAAAVPGGFGTGKTVLLQQIAKWCDADVIVYVGCGERGNEMADVVGELATLSDPRTGGRLADRTVVIANTSNMPIMAREASIYTGVTVAEYYRDMGLDVVVIADSTSRWAEALREFASRTGALPAEEGYPAGLASALAAFYERSGRVVTLGGVEGSVTVIGAVSPPGGDLTEPVTAQTQRFVRSLWTLDRDLAYARHYPAVTWVGSYCRDAAAVGAWYAAHGDVDWAARQARVVALLAEADRLASLAELIGLAALPGHERVVMLGGRLLREGMLQQNALSTMDAYSSPEKSAALIDMVLGVVDRCERLIEAGTPASAIEEFDFSPVIRAREENGPADADGVRLLGKRVQAMLEETL
ncbi:MAG TPA: V-type ATP synthase subunit A [Pilimelia sp.]|nr:V-type ATP synthase subunit A [Pilimelia sp.]